MSSAKRIVGIILVFGLVSIAWLVLGGVMLQRSASQSGALRGSVSELWGSPQSQQAPALIFHWDTLEERISTETSDGRERTVRRMEKVHHSKNLMPASTRIAVGLTLDQRLKGLVWYSLYNIDFKGAWEYRHREPIPGQLEVSFSFPDASGIYDNFRIAVAEADRGSEATPVDGRIDLFVEVQPGQRVPIEISYHSRGMDEWRYLPAPGVGNLEDFALAMTTDFKAIDFPAATMSPSTRSETATGHALEWKFARAVTGQQIGMVMPARIQPGEMAAQLAFSAPISVLFFFLLMFVLATLRNIEIHPINYFFLAGAFFAFHLLFGYSVDHVQLVPAFVLSSAVSIFLVVTYLRLVVSPRFAFVEAALAQLVYLVGFSLAHFWEGYTGLTVTVLSVLTLFLLMQLTGRIRWAEALGRKPAPTPVAATSAG
ncbi:MAG: inner membrane CreD family protein [Deltaproteobacteria bacterium]|nr:inner membrane CreD family protein [Deltaproteobacteria bacterium]